MKRNSSIIFYVLIFIAILLDWEKWNIGENTTILLVNYIQLSVIILLVTAFIWSILNILKHWKTNKIHSFIPIVIMTFVISGFTFLPITEFGIKTNYMFNQQHRENIIELLDQGNLAQSDVNEFTLPFIYRLSSHTGRIIVQSSQKYTNNHDKVLFYVRCGANKSSAIIYSANDKTITNGDFGRDYDNVKKLKPKWYIATMTWQK